MRTTLCTVARVPTSCISVGLGTSSRGSSWVATTIDRSSPRDSMSWIELSRPTVRGRTACGKSTVSRTGRTGTCRFPEAEGGFMGGKIVGWLGTECPPINFSYLEHSDQEKFQESRLCTSLSLLLRKSTGSKKKDAVGYRISLLLAPFSVNGPEGSVWAASPVFAAPLRNVQGGTG